MEVIYTLLLKRTLFDNSLSGKSTAHELSHKTTKLLLQTVATIFTFTWSLHCDTFRLPCKWPTANYIGTL